MNSNFQNTPSNRAHSASLDLCLPVSMPSGTSQLVNEIRFNIDLCSANRLSVTSKWLGELLVSVIQPSSSYESRAPTPVFSPLNYVPGAVFREDASPQNDVLKLARNLFDLREFKKCEFMLANHDSQQAVFLRNFARYLVSE